jgi:hypothetical protein
MEALSRMLSATVESGLLSWCSMGSRNQKEMIVSHLLFAYDTLLFCEPSVEQYRKMRCLLLCFEAVSRLKINLSNFEIVPIGDVGDVKGIASIIGCGVASRPKKPPKKIQKPKTCPEPSTKPSRPS